MSTYDPTTQKRTPLDSDGGEASEPEQATTAPLAGLLAGNTAIRKRVYYGYASAALVVSFIPDVVVAGVLSGHEADALTMWGALASSILLKIGVAFGFIAASNTGR